MKKDKIVPVFNYLKASAPQHEDVWRMEVELHHS
jgi:hypothetical protein